MIEKKTIIDQIEITRDGHVQVRFAKQILEDGKEISCQWHRTVIEPGVNVDTQLSAVNAHLINIHTPIDDAERVSMLHAVVKSVHTKEVIGKFKEKAESRIK